MLLNLLAIFRLLESFQPAAAPAQPPRCPPPIPPTRLWPEGELVSVEDGDRSARFILRGPDGTVRQSASVRKTSAR